MKCFIQFPFLSRNLFLSTGTGGWENSIWSADIILLSWKQPSWCRASKHHPKCVSDLIVAHLFLVNPNYLKLFTWFVRQVFLKPILKWGFMYSPVMEPGWSPLPSDPKPYFQVDFLEPTWVSGVVTQGSGRMTGYLTKYRLAFALHGNTFTDYTEDGKPGSPPQVCAWL